MNFISKIPYLKSVELNCYILHCDQQLLLTDHWDYKGVFDILFLTFHTFPLHYTMKKA